MSYNLSLLFEPGINGPPIAHILIKAHSVDDEERILITPQCMSFEEFEYQVDRLVKELEGIRKEAKRTFRT